MDALLGSLNSAQLDLLRETEPARMAELDEDDLLRLHSRIRRARNKYTKNYRRRASKRVDELGARGASRPKNRRAADKAEVFEDALARVSHQVDIVARAAAQALKEERLAAVAAQRSSGPGKDGGGRQSAGTEVRRTARKTTGGVKRDASSQAAGARRQAKRDSR